MAINAGAVEVDVIPNTTKFGAELQGKMNSLGKTLSTGASNALIGLGAAAAAGIVKSITATVQLARETKTLQRVTGQSAESASALIAVSNEFGLTTAQLTVGLGLFDKSIVNNSKNLLKYGLSLRNAQGQIKPFDVILGEAADKFRSLPSAADQAAFAMNVFGRSGKALIPILRLGSVGIRQLEQQARSLGVVIGQKTEDQAISLGIAFHELGQSVKGLGVQIGSAFIPVAHSVVTAATEMIEAFTHLPAAMKTVTLTAFVVVGALAAVIRVGRALTSIFGPLVGQLVAMGKAAAAYAVDLLVIATNEGIAAAAGAAFEAVLGALAGPITLIVGAVALLTAGFLQNAHDAATNAKAVQGLSLAIASGATSLAALNAQLDSRNLPDWAKQQIRAEVITKANTQALKLEAEAHKLAAKSGITYAAALKIVVGLEEQATGTTVDLNQALSEQQLGKVGAFVQGASGAVADFAKISGQSTDTIVSDFTKMTTAGSTLESVTTTIDDMKAAFAGFKDSIAANLGGPGAALASFANKAKVNLGDAVKSLKTYTSQIHTFSTDIAKIQDRFGAKANAFIDFAQQQGLAQLGLVTAVADGTKKTAKAFIDNWQTAQGATTSLADQIATALGAAFQKVIFKLTNIARAIRGLPPLQPKVDDGQIQHAQSELDKINGAKLSVGLLVHGQSDLDKVLNTMSIIDGSVLSVGIRVHGGIPVVPGGGGEHGGIIPGAALGGFVGNEQIIRVGEHSKKEAIVPLEDPRGLHALAKALREAGAGGDMQVVSGTLRIDESGTAFIDGRARRVAREEQDDDAAFAGSMGRMRG